ncbi:MAG: hypothetical protein M0Z69_03870 [Actinomycetota bacterium]|jgi:hypothetical protein|nr:hypothetical protein [Actinomycetota bacterium]
MRSNTTNSTKSQTAPVAAQSRGKFTIARGAVDDYAISPESISLVRTTSKL